MYRAFLFPTRFLNFSTHPSFRSLSNLVLSHDRRLLNSSKLSLEKYPSDLRNRSISRSGCVSLYFAFIN